MRSKLSLIQITSVVVCTIIMWTTSYSCRDARPRVNVDDLAIDFKFIRFDQALMHVDSTWTEEDLRIDYPFIGSFYIQDILEIDEQDDSSFVQFVQNESIQELLQTSSTAFEQNIDIRNEL